MNRDIKYPVLTPEQIILLEKYSLFLEDHGYIDIDWRAEEPTAINEFIKEYKKDEHRTA